LGVEPVPFRIGEHPSDLHQMLLGARLRKLDIRNCTSVAGGRIRGTMPFFGQYWAYFVPVLMLATAAWYLAILWLLWRIARALERRPL